MRNNRGYRRHAIVLLLAAAGMIICTNPLSASAQAVAPSWSYTGSLNTPRSGHTATPLPDGKVLVAGGYNGDYLDSAELYDPATGTWSVTGSLTVPRAELSATLLPNGKVLVVGGWTRGSFLSAAGTAELYDPATGRWSLTSNPHFTHLGAGTIATLLADGRVLIAGGLYFVNTVTGWFGPSSNAEIYDPATNTWSITGSLHEARISHTATLLPNGQVLVVGGDNLNEFFSNVVGGIVLTNELYDPNTGSWSITGSLNTGRGGHTATVLPGGLVLATGGVSYEEISASYEEISASAELYNLTTGTWHYTGSLSPREYHTATLLPNGRVLVAGGHDGNNVVGNGEVYDPASGSWSATASLNTARVAHTATLLSNGKVLVVGGVDGDDKSLRTAELYDPGTPSPPNPIDDPQFFVRQHYKDFLNRDADPDGLAFWTNEISSCGGDTRCIEVKRINDSASFFLSIEFQETGYLVYRFYKASYGNALGAPVPLRLNDFLPDTKEIGQGVVVNQSGWEQLLESNKQVFATEFVQRSRFVSAYPTSMSSEQFVDALFANAGVTPSANDRTAAINEFSFSATTNDVAARARALRRVAENSTLQQQEFNRAFVLMQYFGYLRRNPNDAPEAGLNFAGYNFWLNKLDSFKGDFAQAEMVKAFINSAEYRQRFGP